jgi:hypothetical protein
VAMTSSSLLDRPTEGWHPVLFLEVAIIVGFSHVSLDLIKICLVTRYEKSVSWASGRYKKPFASRESNKTI